MKHIIIVDGNKNIIIDDNTIMFESRGIGPVFKIMKNKSVVLKVNKQSISTCNIDILADYLRQNADTARSLFNRMAYAAIYADLIPVEFLETSVPGFFSGMTDSEFSEFLQRLDLVNNGSARAAAVKRVIFSYLCCDDHNAKMAGMISFSSYVKYNPFCICRRDNCPGAICEHCFAYDQTSAYRDQAEKLKKAHIFINAVTLYPADVPSISIDKFPFFRLESFGDICSAKQFVNYTVIAAALNQNVTLWTKNPGIVKQALSAGAVIPDNMRIILSSLFVNKPVTLEYITLNGYDKFISAVFTVYSPDYIAAHNVNINCGARHCLSCARCYTLPAPGAGIVWINEKLK